MVIPQLPWTTWTAYLMTKWDLSFGGLWLGMITQKLVKNYMSISLIYIDFWGLKGYQTANIYPNISEYYNKLHIYTHQSRIQLYDIYWLIL